MNDELNGNVWLNELRAEESVAAPRPQFKAELRARLGAEWDGVATDTQSPPTTHGQSTTPAPSVTQAMPVGEAAPVRSAPSQRRHAGGPSQPGVPTEQRISSAFSWPRLAAAAAIVAVFAGGFVLMAQRGGNEVVVTDTVPSTPVSAVPLPTTTSPATVPNSTIAPPPTTPATTAPEPATTPAPTSSTSVAPRDTTPTTASPPSTPVTTVVPAPPPAKPGVPLLFDQFPFQQSDPKPSVDKFQHYLPAKLPGETQVLKSGASDEAFAVGLPVFVQAYRVGDAMVTVVTEAVDASSGVAESTGENIDTSGWANQWPTAYYAVAPNGAIRIVVGNGDGAVIVTAVGLDKATATQFVAGLMRRPAPQAGWDPSMPATSQAEGWQEQAYELRALFLSDPDTPIDQINVYSAFYVFFPWVKTNSSVQFVDINGQPGAVSSSDGLVTVSWITSDGAGVRFIHKGEWADAVALARTVQPVSVAEWDARIDGIENKTGAEVTCFYLSCE